jgi:hypothetical protein
MKYSREVTPLNVTLTPYFVIPYLQSNVADVRSSEVDEKLALVSVRQWRFVC